jgi:hypothetical protein
MVMLCLVVLASGCISNNKQTNTTKTYSQNNISFNYPGGWEIADATAPNVVVAVADPNTVENGSPTTLVVVQKPDVASGSDLNNVYSQNYAKFFNNTNYQRVSEGNITINGQNALENIYKTNSTVDPKQYRAIWLDENGTIFVILFSAKVSDFDNQQNNFNLILNSFKSQ